MPVLISPASLKGGGAGQILAICSMNEVQIISNFSIRNSLSYGCDRLLYQNLQWRNMVIRREGSGVSSLKNLEAWRWPPRGSVAVPTSVLVDKFSNFSKGVKWGDLEDGRQNPTGKFRSKTPVGDPGYFVPQKLKQNVTLLYTFILTFSV